jgi:hypothetical protein
MCNARMSFNEFGGPRGEAASRWISNLPSPFKTARLS